MSEREPITNRIKPRAFGDMRGWIDALRAEGELHEINAEVDWDCELGAIARRAFGTGHGPALLFNNIKGYGAKDDVWSRQIFTGGIRTPSSKIERASIGIEPTTLPPMSLWWPNIAV